ncbi:MAG: SDR family oxidoreductase [Acidimicrobiales bacterium]|jgi:NAD(P)-dependent dehydrogenase (short-subunit alcohol dehydrogenase family)
MEFLNKHVAVTGASGGIGRVLSGYLAERGLTVFGLDIVTDPAPPPGVRSLPVDVTVGSSVAEAVSSCYELASGPVDLVCCAGIVENDVPAEEMPIEQFEAVLAVDLRGVFLSCQAFGRRLLDSSGGSIVNVASMSGNCVVNFPQHQCAYNASKAAVTALTKSLAVEWGPRGVRLNTISPGYVDTPLLSLKPHQFEQWKAGVVLGRFAEPVEIARAVAFLLSTESSYCCGTELVIDGGYSLR